MIHSVVWCRVPDWFDVLTIATLIGFGDIGRKVSDSCTLLYCTEHSHTVNDKALTSDDQVLSSIELIL